MRNFIIILTLIFGQAMLAQKFKNKIYLEFGLSSKLHYTRKYNLTPPLHNKYYTINQLQWIFPGSVLLNFNVGYKFNNSNELVFGVINNDETQVGYFASIPSVTTFTPNLVLGNVVSKGYGGGAGTTNISVIYKNLLIKHYSPSFKKDNYFGIQFNLGLSYFYRPNAGIQSLTGPYGLTVTAPDSNKVTVMVTNYFNPIEFKRSFKLNTGFTFLFGKNDKESFALTVSYITGRPDSFSSNYSFTNVETRVTNNSGIKELFNYYTVFYGRGNGIYFTLSKKVFQFKILQDRRQKKIEKFKTNSM